MHLHIVSFDIPYPANYGGIIDVFYKLKALHREGIKVVLHCFRYDRQPASELETYCERVYYYPRKTGWTTNLSYLPYIVRSRMPAELLANLLRDDQPVLFEGLHTCGFIMDPWLRGRLLIYRESNIEHHYYYHLFRAEKNPLRKLFFLTESARLRLFQRNLRFASVFLTVSGEDTQYLSSCFPGKRVIHLPSFHKDDEVNILPGKGNYALYQGKLAVAENSRAVEYIIDEIWEDGFPELVIAGLDPPGWLISLIAARPNIRLVANPSDPEMNTLIRHAQLNIMITFQATGLKLKLLNAMYNGRFCLVNPAMTTGTGLEALCVTEADTEGFKRKIHTLFSETFTEEMISRRKLFLDLHYSNTKNCKLLKEILTLS